jgi:hypothetical protein
MWSDSPLVCKTTMCDLGSNEDLLVRSSGLQRRYRSPEAYRVHDDGHSSEKNNLGAWAKSQHKTV